jgi:hypothetical protein
MSRRVDMHPSKLDPEHDVIEYRDDGGYLLMRDSERRHIINWIKRVTSSTYDGEDYAEMMYLLQGRQKE